MRQTSPSMLQLPLHLRTEHLWKHDKLNGLQIPESVDLYGTLKIHNFSYPALNPTQNPSLLLLPYISVVSANINNIIIIIIIIIKMNSNNNNNNNNNNSRIQRRNSRFFTIFSLRREPSPTRTLKLPGRNCVQIMYSTSSACHVQHVLLHATWYKGTAQLLSLTEFKSHLFELYFIG